jgi:hypothetical protein
MSGLCIEGGKQLTVRSGRDVKRKLPLLGGLERSPLVE